MHIKNWSAFMLTQPSEKKPVTKLTKQRFFWALLLSLLPMIGFVPGAAQSRVADSVNVCKKYLGTCEYYSCFEKNHLSCGTQGYILGYGKKFCEKFSRTHFPEPMPQRGTLIVNAAVERSRILFPTEGNAWVSNVRLCLQEALETRNTHRPIADCQELRAFGFESHPTCYTTGPSFCELTPQNISRAGLVIGVPTLLTAESRQQIQETALICVNQLADRIKKEQHPGIKSDLRAFRGLWQILVSNPRSYDRLMDGISLRQP